MVVLKLRQLVFPKPLLRDTDGAMKPVTVSGTEFISVPEAAIGDPAIEILEAPTASRRPRGKRGKLRSSGERGSPDPVSDDRRE